ncbi:hypothetical protein Tco_0118761, partial [Tanacetum coccineum]
MFDVMHEDNIDHMEADNAQSEGRTKEMVDEDKELDEERLSTKECLDTSSVHQVLKGLKKHEVKI